MTVESPCTARLPKVSSKVMIDKEILKDISSIDCIYTDQWMIYN